jgi:hypothetical protein
MGGGEFSGVLWVCDVFVLLEGFEVIWQDFGFGDEMVMLGYVEERGVW